MNNLAHIRYCQDAYRTEQNRTYTLFTQGLCIQTCEDMIQIQNDDMVDT